MFLDQFRSRQRAEIKHGVVYRVVPFALIETTT
jgi:hypothetical protein